MFNTDYYTTELRNYFPRAQSYEYDERVPMMIIEDPAWGEEIIGDQPGDEVFFELFLHPAVQRLAGIEQLTLPETLTTMPDASDFSRWEHAWGSVVLTRKLIRKAEAQGREFSDQEKIELQMRTFLSDMGHSAFSHLGDWLRQGFDGPETHHDLTLMEYLEVSDVNGILRRHDIKPERVVFPPDKSDWVECPAPGLCIDRVDYAVREIIRWLDPEPDSVWWLSQFEISEDNQLVMTDPKIATYFATGFGLLTTEHWGNPMQQLQLQLFAELIKDVLHDDTYMLRGTGIHPRDRLFTIDRDIMQSARYPIGVRKELVEIMLDIGRAQRRNYVLNRANVLTDMMYRLRTAGADPVFPSPAQNPNDWSKPAYYAPHHVEVYPIEHLDDAKKFKNQRTSIDFTIPRKKPRGVDPPVKTGDLYVPISSQKPALAAFMRAQQNSLRQEYFIRLYSSPNTIKRLKKGFAETLSKGDWQSNEPYEPDGLINVLRSVGGMAIGYSNLNIRYTY